MSEELSELAQFISEYEPSLGKFEGEPAYVEYFWNQCLDGSYDDEIYFPDETPGYVINLSDEDCETCEIEPENNIMVLWESNEGFVFCDLYNQDEYDDLLERIQEEIAEALENDNEEID